MRKKNTEAADNMWKATQVLHIAVKRSLCFGRRGVCVQPHPKKAHRGGEDAFFSHPRGIGVADGVGGYASHGIDPAVYTRNVMRFTLDAVQADASSDGITALEALNEGCKRALQAGDRGGCPVTLVTLVGDIYASVLNLGDCGTIVLRDNRLFYRTEMQQHSFNCPFQLPDDSPSCGEQARLEVKEGDIFLCASDGVLDNVEVDDLLAHMRRTSADGCARVAEAIGKHASTNAIRKDYLSPFAKHAMEAGYRYMGGKVDDVTALVSVVTRGADLLESCAPLITDLLSMENHPIRL